MSLMEAVWRTDKALFQLQISVESDIAGFDTKDQISQTSI